MLRDAPMTAKCRKRTLQSTYIGPLRTRLWDQNKNCSISKAAHLSKMRADFATVWIGDQSYAHLAFLLTRLLLIVLRIIVFKSNSGQRLPNRRPVCTTPFLICVFVGRMRIILIS